MSSEHYGASHHEAPHQYLDTRTITESSRTLSRAGEASAVSWSADDGGALDAWLSPFLGLMGRSTRRRWGPLYVRGLLDPDGSKKVLPIASRLGLAGHDQLHHFISSPAWDDAPLWQMLAKQADKLVGGADAVLVVDDTTLHRKGALSVGVAPQYCGEHRKPANCQALASLTLTSHDVPIPVGLRLLLPASWAGDPARCAAAGVPETVRVPLAKPEVAMAEIDRLTMAGARFGCVVAALGYGSSAAFRHGLSARGLRWVAEVPRTQKVHVTEVEFPWLHTGHGRPQTRPGSGELPLDAAAALSGPTSHRLAWRQGTAGALAVRVAAVPVRVADGPITRRALHQQGEEVWLVGEWRSSGERKFYLTNIPCGHSLKTLTAALKARRVCELGHQQLKQELGLGAFEGRSWTGLHRHALMGCIAFAYLQHLRINAAERDTDAISESRAA